MLLAHISAPILVVITFRSISVRCFPEVLGKSKHPRWLSFDNHDVITMSFDDITSHYRPVIAFILAKLWRGEGWNPPPPGARRQKKTPLDRVK